MNRIILQYLCNPTGYTMFYDQVYSYHLVTRHVSDLNGPSSGAYSKLYFANLVCGILPTTQYVRMFCLGITSGLKVY